MYTNIKFIDYAKQFVFFYFFMCMFLKWAEHKDSD